MLLDVQKLRAVAIIMVLFGHLPYAMPNSLLHGYTGVSLFFVISGFVVAMTFLKSLPSNSDEGSVLRYTRDFYARRVFRIVPVAVIWVAIYFLIAQLIRLGGGAYGDLARWGREVSWLASGFFNYFFAASHAPGLFGQYWSLAVEMQFYAVLPALLIAFRSPVQRIWLCVISIVGVWTVLRAVTPSDQIGLLTHTQMDALFAGVLLYVIVSMRHAPTGGNASPRSSWMVQALKNLVLALIVVALMLLPAKMDGVVEPILKYPTFTVLAFVAVYLAQRDTGWVFGGSKIFDSFLGYVGDRSYSLYVCHVIFFSGVYPFLTQRFPGLVPAWMTTSIHGRIMLTAVMFGIALAMAGLSYRWIELPFISLGKRVVGRWDSRSEAALAAQVPAAESSAS